jgi:hypothetical protein
MAYATLQEIRDLTSFPEVAGLSDSKLQNYIDRASSWIRRDTGRDFEGEDNPDILSDLRIATLLLVEYLWYWDNPEQKESSLGGFEIEHIGSYSYNRANPGEKTGNEELDSILSSLRKEETKGAFFFSVYGPSRVRD